MKIGSIFFSHRFVPELNPRFTWECGPCIYWAIRVIFLGIFSLENILAHSQSMLHAHFPTLHTYKYSVGRYYIIVSLDPSCGNLKSYPFFGYSDRFLSYFLILLNIVRIYSVNWRMGLTQPSWFITDIVIALKIHCYPHWDLSETVHYSIIIVQYSKYSAHSYSHPCTSILPTLLVKLQSFSDRRQYFIS